MYNIAHRACRLSGTRLGQCAAGGILPIAAVQEPGLYWVPDVGGRDLLPIDAWFDELTHCYACNHS
jgi:hypothetical protein